MKISDTYALRTRVAVILEGKIQRKYNIRDANNCRAVDILGALSIYFNRKLPPHILYRLQGPPLGFDIMYLALVDRNMQVRFGLKVVGES